MRMSYETFMGDVKNYFKSFTMISQVKLACFIVVILIMYLIFEHSFLKQFRDDIWLTQAMINLIPTKLLLNNKKLKDSVLFGK